jgi:hypothetical protein
LKKAKRSEFSSVERAANAGRVEKTVLARGRPAAFNVGQPWIEQAFHGAEYGWAKMLKQLPAVVAGLAAGGN